MNEIERQAFAKLSVSTEYRIVREFLLNRLDGYDHQNRIGDGTKGHWVQGRSQELSEIIELIDSADKPKIREVKKMSF